MGSWEPSYKRKREKLDWHRFVLNLCHQGSFLGSTTHTILLSFFGSTLLFLKWEMGVFCVCLSNSLARALDLIVLPFLCGGSSTHTLSMVLVPFWVVGPFLDHLGKVTLPLRIRTSFTSTFELVGLPNRISRSFLSPIIHVLPPHGIQATFMGSPSVIPLPLWILGPFSTSRNHVLPPHGIQATFMGSLSVIPLPLKTIYKFLYCCKMLVSHFSSRKVHPIPALRKVVSLRGDAVMSNDLPDFGCHQVRVKTLDNFDGLNLEGVCSVLSDGSMNRERTVLSGSLLMLRPSYFNCSLRAADVLLPIHEVRDEVDEAYERHFCIVPWEDTTCPPILAQRYWLNACGNSCMSMDLKSSDSAAKTARITSGRSSKSA